ncbi:LPS export ABC transporter periplasmic protein LptC [candidate division KSB1 bacterium]|nr:LPS export ABC transporter periplasmic protein LptC [candidate division KSB1 bacterium]
MTFPALLALLALALCSGCTKIGGPDADKAAGELPEQELYNATIRFYQSERTSAILRAGRIRKFQKQSTVLLDQRVHIDFFNQAGQHTTSLVSDSARADDTKHDMVAMGHVVAKSDSGEILETQFLRWENKTRRIISDAPVKLSTPTDTLFGSHFVSDEHLRNWQIEQPTGVTFRELEQRAQRDSAAGAPPDTAANE